MTPLAKKPLPNVVPASVKSIKAIAGPAKSTIVPAKTSTAPAKLATIVKVETVEPRQFAQIGTAQFTGATIIPHSGDNDEATDGSQMFEEEEMELEELEELAFDEEDYVLGDEPSDIKDLLVFKKEPNTTGVAGGQPRRVLDSSNSSFHYDSSFDQDDQKLRLSKAGIDEEFACRHCGKRYRWKSTLRRHEKVECGGRAPSYGCPYCSYKAKQRGNLGVHVRKHHPEKPQLASRRSKK